MHLEAVQVVGVAAVIVYRRRVDRRPWSVNEIGLQRREHSVVYYCK